MFEIVEMHRTHIPAVAHLHAQALAGDFLPSLGTGFLQVFYRAALQQQVAFGFVALDQGQPVGFVLGSAQTDRLFRRVLMTSALALGVAALPALMRQPALLGNLLETFFYPQREAVCTEPAELVVIAVAAGSRGQGIGEALVGALNQSYVQSGLLAYKVTVLQTNTGANRFYQRQGFQPAGAFQLYRKNWNVYRMDLAHP